MRAEAPLTRSTVTVPRAPARAASASATAAAPGGRVSRGRRASTAASCRRAPYRPSAPRPPARPGSRPCARLVARLRGRVGPGQCGAVRVGGVGGGQHDSLRRRAVTPLPRRGGRAQPVHGAIHGELGRARGPPPRSRGGPRPLSSNADSTRYVAEKPPSTPSAATAPRVTTPCRSSSVRAKAWARWVASGSGGGSRAQRPDTVGGPEREAVRPGVRADPYAAPSAVAVSVPYRPRGTCRLARWAVDPRCGPSRGRTAAGRGCRW